MQQTMETYNPAGPAHGPTAAPPGGKTYDMGYSDLFMELLERRSAARSATHLLPFLRPGMDLLDLGCGPGLITLGLARAVCPGEVTGLDRDGEQIGIARANARLEGVENTCFVPGDSMDLPFPSNSMDVVHCHAFLMHSPSIQEQLTEIVRVLKPGGILSSRDMDVPASFISSARDDNQGMWDMLGEMVRQEGGDSWMGRHLKTFFRNAGLEDVETGFSADSFTNPEEVKFLARFLCGMGAVPGVHGADGKLPRGLRPVAGTGGEVERSPRRGGLLPIRPRRGAEALEGRGHARAGGPRSRMGHPRSMSRRGEFVNRHSPMMLTVMSFCR